MAVYVDGLVNYGWRLRGRVVKSCHMFADSTDELNEMALKIGLKKKWIQYKSLIHYDLTESRRKKAIQFGAIEVDRCFVVKKIRERRNNTSY